MQFNLEIKKAKRKKNANEKARHSQQINKQNANKNQNPNKKIKRSEKINKPKR